MMIFRAILLQTLPRLASVAPLARLILDQWEWPAIFNSFGTSVVWGCPGRSVVSCPLLSVATAVNAIRDSRGRTISFRRVSLECRAPTVNNGRLTTDLPQPRFYFCAR